MEMSSDNDKQNCRHRGFSSYAFSNLCNKMPFKVIIQYDNFKENIREDLMD